MNIENIGSVEGLNLNCKSCAIPKDMRKELCPYCVAQNVLKGKWKFLIIWHLMDTPKRFSELKKLVPATQSSLTLQLRELEKIGVVHREVYSSVPPKVEYSLTPIGKEFLSVLKSMQQWGAKFSKSL